MVLQLMGSERLLMIRWKIETLLPKRYKGTRTVKFTRYLPGGSVANRLGISENTLLLRLATSRKAHALRINKRLMVHPDALVYLLKKKYQTVIKKELCAGIKIMAELSEN